MAETESAVSALHGFAGARSTSPESIATSMDWFRKRNRKVTGCGSSGPVFHGRRCELGLGPARLVTVAEAKEAALANSKVTRAGGDPIAAKGRGIPMSQQASAKVNENNRPD